MKKLRLVVAIALAVGAVQAVHHAQAKGVTDPPPGWPCDPCSVNGNVR